MDKDEAVMIDCSIGYGALARLRRDAGKVLAYHIHCTP
jgi:hypothetical protein